MAARSSEFSVTAQLAAWAKRGPSMASRTPTGCTSCRPRPDGVDLAPDGAKANQNFKLVSRQDVLGALDLAPSRFSPFQ